MDDYYITSEIVVKKQKLYFLKNEEKNKITMKNWHKYLADIGWRKIDNKWIRKLNKYSLSKDMCSLNSEVTYSNLHCLSF